MILIVHNWWIVIVVIDIILFDFLIELSCVLHWRTFNPILKKNDFFLFIVLPIWFIIWWHYWSFNLFKFIKFYMDILIHWIDLTYRLGFWWQFTFNTKAILGNKLIFIQVFLIRVKIDVLFHFLLSPLFLNILKISDSWTNSRFAPNVFIWWCSRCYSWWTFL